MGKAERTKQSIIEHAAPIYNEKGIAGTSIDDVLKAAKVAKGCLYNHFENKEALTNETVDYLLELICAKTMAVINRGKTAKQKLFAYLDANIDPMNTPVEGGCPMFNMAIESDDNNPIVKQKVKRSLLRTQHNFTNILKEGIDKGELSAELRAEEFAFKIISSMEGATVICRVIDDNTHMINLINSLKAELATYELT